MATEVRKRRPRCWVWQYFKKLDESSAKCSLCAETLKYRNLPLHQLQIHLSLVHGVTSYEQNKLTWKEESILLWRYFTEDENLTEATCKRCGSVLVKVQLYLQSHLQYCHSNVIDIIYEELKCSWVSQHFKFDMKRCDINCIHCEWIFKIFVGINHLESHLFQCHKINENSGSNDGINNDNRNIIIQQSVEENYASTSSHHDNRHEQDAGNQTVQQQDNTKRQHEDNTRQHDSSTRSEDDNHDTASAMWQPWK